jgi:hypothetical protein
VLIAPADAGAGVASLLQPWSEQIESIATELAPRRSLIFLFMVI